MALSPTSSHSAGGGTTFTGLGLGEFASPPTGYTNLIPFTYTNTAPDASYPDIFVSLSTTAAAAFATGLVGKLNDGQVALTQGTASTNDLSSCVGWQTGSPAITCDLGSALAVLECRIYGIIQTAAGVMRPSAVLLAYSDDNITYTTVENRTGLTNGSGGGVWECRFDTSASGNHRYYRYTLTRGTTWVHVSEIRFLST